MALSGAICIHKGETMQNVKKLHIQALVAVLCFVMIMTTIVSSNTDRKLLNIDYSDLTPVAQKEIDCLADNIYYEAGYESEAGQVAVALVTLNRLNDPRYPKKVCDVVKQKVNTTCQFSWVCLKLGKLRNNDVYESARKVALHVYSNYENLIDITQGSLFYHANYVNPKWKLQKTVVIGRHIFYKESI